MVTQLIQVLAFVGVGAGGQATLSHNINLNGLSVRPDIVERDDGSFSIVSVTTTQVTVQNNGGMPASLNLWLERKHSIVRAIGASIANLSPQPFIPAAGSASSGSLDQVFQYIVTGVEPDLDDITIVLPAARANANYAVFPAQEQFTNLLGMGVLTASKTNAQFILSLSGFATAGDKFSFFVTDL